MSPSFFSRRSVFGVSVALLILLVFFFFFPSIIRGARLAVAGKKNNIKDWLPNDFRETVELSWFAQYFMGESFVLATWDGCTEDDQRLRLFSAKLSHESAQRVVPDSAEHRRARELAEKLQLFLEPSTLDNWGGLGEKWFASPSGRYYYLTPDGQLFRWLEGSNAVGGLGRMIKRSLGSYQLRGELIADFSQPSEAGRVNDFYNDPTLLAASLFQTVQTGADLVEQLAVEGGPLWPIDLTDLEQRAGVARTRATERLTGTMFAPALPADFDWTPGAVFDRLPVESRESVPADFDFLVRSAVEQIQQRFGGTAEGLRRASMDERAQAWEELCRAIGIPLPPRQTCILVTLTPLGKDHLGRSVGRGVVGGPRGRLMILADESGLAAAPPPSMAPPPFDRDALDIAVSEGRPVLRLGGPPVDNVAIDEEGTVTLVRLVGYSGVIGLGLAFLCFRSFNLTLMVFTVGVSAAALGLAICYWAGCTVDAILMTMPSLIYVLGISGAIHIVNYYRDEVYHAGTPGAASRAIKHAMAPCFLAAFTTALGLISLCTSNIVPIYNFGLYSAIAVMTTLLILFTYLPAALETFPPAFALARVSPRSPAVGDHEPEFDGESNGVTEFWAAFGRLVTSHYRLMIVLCLMIFAAGLLGLPKIKTSVQLLKLFDSKARIIADYGYLESNFGKLVPMELVIRVPPVMISKRTNKPEVVTDPDRSLGSRSATADTSASGSAPVDVALGGQAPTEYRHPLTLLQRAEAVDLIDTAVRRTLGESGTGVIGRTMSAVTFLPPLPEPSSSYSPVRSRFESGLAKSLDDLSTSDFFRYEKSGPFDGSELWRVSLRVGALNDVDYGQFVDDLRKTVAPVLDAYRARDLILSACEAAASDRQSSADAAANPVMKRKIEAPRVLLLGYREPQSMGQEDFLEIGSPAERDREIAAAIAAGRQSDLIRTDRLYVSALAELLAGERIRRPVWIDVDSDQAKVKPGDAQWQSLLEAVDVVVLLGDQQAIDAETLASQVEHFVDARSSSLPRAEPTLIGSVPTELNPGPLEAIYTGIVPVVYKAQRTLLISLIQSIFLAFVMIAVVMILLLTPGKFPAALFRPRPFGYGVVAGLIAMVPNVFPLVVVFGAMGHAMTLVDIGTMMTASVAMGIAVDDTIHFLTWFRLHIDRGMTRVEAIIETYRRVGPAMMQTTLVAGLGLFVFALSTFAPTQKFGTLMLVMLGVALVGDLVLMPALLASPLGSWFAPRSQFEPLAADVPARPHQPAIFADLPDTTGNQGRTSIESVSDLVSVSAAHQPPPDPIGNLRPTARSDSRGNRETH